MQTITSSLTISWDIHDSWTETLAGAVFLIDILKNENKIGDKSHLCRLILISANHLIEKLFFDLADKFADKEFIEEIGGKRKFDNESLYNAMKSWPQKISKIARAIDFNIEPFVSADLLRKQRNRSIHKNSEFVSLEMAQKALFTSVNTCQAIWVLFMQDKPFKYEGFIKKYQIDNLGHYSTVNNINLKLCQYKITRIQQKLHTIFTVSECI